MLEIWLLSFAFIWIFYFAFVSVGIKDFYLFIDASCMGISKVLMSQIEPLPLIPMRRD